MAKEEVEQLFQQVLQNAEALREILGGAAESQTIVDDVNSLVNEREALLLRLRQLLHSEPNVEPYRAYYERCKDVDASLTQKLTSLLENLSHKMNEAKQNKRASKQYDAYLRLMPYGAFIDDKK